MVQGSEKKSMGGSPEKGGLRRIWGDGVREVGGDCLQERRQGSFSRVGCCERAREEDRDREEALDRKSVV